MSPLSFSLDAVQEEPGLSDSTIPLSYHGLATVVAAGSYVEVEAFIDRMVQSIGAHVVDTKKLADSAKRWYHLTRPHTGDDKTMKLIYEELLAGICTDARTSRDWVVRAANNIRDASHQAGSEISSQQANGISSEPGGNSAELEALRVIEWLRPGALQGSPPKLQAWKRTTQEESASCFHSQTLQKSAL
jgi:hypothetical protein